MATTAWFISENKIILLLFKNYWHINRHMFKIILFTIQYSKCCVVSPRNLKSNQFHCLITVCFKKCFNCPCLYRCVSLKLLSNQLFKARFWTIIFTLLLCNLTLSDTRGAKICLMYLLISFNDPKVHFWMSSLRNTTYIVHMSWLVELNFGDTST